MITIVFTLLSAGCTDDKGNESSASTSCTGVTDSMGRPKTIEDTINLINALPRPLSLECFLNSLKAPLNVFAVNSTFSAQPAVDQNSPRIFILQDKMVLSVAPAGIGRTLLEFSELNGSIETFKGELEFPIEGTVTMDTILAKISQTSTTSTCLTCHTSERKVAYKTLGSLYVSKILRPNESQRINSSYLKNQATACNPSINKHRCEVLNAIFVNGQAQDASFPF
ncbi:MAG: hypothetical protein JNL11_10115 [Bdellovibrionaceae bacterium]|nr:hypothetical protein [Pseudobdellovibrionaceae bacterium]